MAGELKHHTLSVNGIRMHVAEQGTGPLVLMCHGWPELWYSWRHQLPAVAAAGFRAVAPDMRGFGETEAPADVNDYTILHNVGDVVALVAALGEKKAIIVGHDWGAPVAWTAAMMRPDLFPAVVAMSVPHRPRSAAAPLKTLKEAGLGNYYWIYFQTPGVAEAEFERDPAVTLRKLLYGVSGDIPIDRENPMMVQEGHGFLDPLAVAPALPAWLREEDIQKFAAEYRRTGFRGGLNWYRNIDRNWELTAPWQDATIRQPALFIAGTRDPVIAGKRGAGAIEHMSRAVPGVQKVLIEGAGHWIQQERPERVNAALVEFLAKSATSKEPIMLRRYRLAALACAGALAILASTSVVGAERAKPEFLASPDPSRADLPFSEAVRAGDLMFLSGQIGYDSATGKVVPGGIKAEALQSLTLIKDVLTRNGASLADVVKCTVFLADIAEWPVFNEVYGQFFKKPYPARSALAASGLARNARVEIECVAYAPKK